MAGTSDAQALLLTMSADTSKALKAIDKLNARLSGLAPEFEKHGKKAMEGLERSFTGQGFGKALDKVFDSSKLAVLDEGSAKLRIFGSALEPLGPLGIAAAAGVVALAAAFEESHKAIEYADSLYKAAAAAHVSTDALQEYQAAIVKAGGDANAAGPALLEFSQILGKGAEGLRGLRPFQALFGKSFGTADVKALGDSERAIDAVVAKIQNLSTRSQQDAAINQFGLQGLAPLILAGADAWKTYREEASAAGLVLDKDVIRNAHELSVQMDELSSKIKNQLTEAFVALGPILVDILATLNKALEFVKDINALRANNDAVTANGGVRFGGAVLNKDGSVSSALDVARSAYARSDHGVAFGLTEAQLQAGLGLPKGKGSLADLSKPQTDHTAELDKAATDAANAGYEAVAKALAALITGIDEHARAEKDAVDAGLNKKLADLDLEAAKIANEKNDANKKSQLALIRKAKIEEQDAAEAQKQLIDQQAATKAMEEFIAYADQIRNNYARIASNSAHMAVTMADRNAIENAEAAKAHQRELDDFDRRAKNSLVGKSGADLDSQISRNKAERLSIVDRQASDDAARAFDLAGPVQQYVRSIQDLNTEIQQDGVSAFRDLTSGLVDAALHAKNLGDVAKNVFLQLAEQIATQFIQKEAAPAFLSVFGLASGGHVSGPGSSTSDSIPAMLSNGEFVVNASATKQHLALLQAINGGKVGRFAEGGLVSAPSFPLLDTVASMKAPRAGGVTVIQPFHFHAEGAVLTDELLGQANATAARMAAQAGQAARAGAISDVQRAGYHANLNQ